MKAQRQRTARAPRPEEAGPRSAAIPLVQYPPEEEIRGGSDVPPQELWDYDSSALAKGLRGSSSSLSLSLLPSTSVS